MKRIKKYIIIMLGILVFILGLLTVYSMNPYEADNTMEDLILADDGITLSDDYDEISYRVADPIANIIIIPGGKVKPNAYKYLAYHLSNSGYNVTIYKPIFNLSILLGNYPKRFIDNEMDNIVIGHSLGGVSAAMLANAEDIDSVVLMGAYATKDISDKNVLSITAEFDLIMNQENYDENIDYIVDATVKEVIGGNHGQFGFYENQKDDGIATITILEQQDVILGFIEDFLQTYHENN